jgi:protein-S-isoprenylcysteine O-methyltransferase Ste14
MTWEINLAIMKNKQDSPGVYIPPPLFYILTFIAAVLIQKEIPLNDTLFKSPAMKIPGTFFFIIALFFSVRSLRQFFKSKNTLILIKPASSLQTDGVYSTSRNPMYVALTILYLAVTCFIGNWWNIILLPLLLLVVQEYIIKREEKYLDRQFGRQYKEYKLKVRRWL